MEWENVRTFGTLQQWTVVAFASWEDGFKHAFKLGPAHVKPFMEMLFHSTAAFTCKPPSQAQ